jgi:hypothetical protein
MAVVAGKEMPRQPLRKQILLKRRASQEVARKNQLSFNKDLEGTDTWQKDRRRLSTCWKQLGNDIDREQAPYDYSGSPNSVSRLIPWNDENNGYDSK